jgi:hypothetical protein
MPLLDISQQGDRQRESLLLPRPINVKRLMIGQPCSAICQGACALGQVPVLCMGLSFLQPIRRACLMQQRRVKKKPLASLIYCCISLHGKHLILLPFNHSPALLYYHLKSKFESPGCCIPPLLPCHGRQFYPTSLC